MGNNSSGPALMEINAHLVTGYCHRAVIGSITYLIYTISLCQARSLCAACGRR